MPNRNGNRWNRRTRWGRFCNTIKTGLHDLDYIVFRLLATVGALSVAWEILRKLFGF
jgi:hypothetical protein